VREAKRNSLLDEFLLNDFFRVPCIRYGQSSQLTLKALSVALSDEHIQPPIELLSIFNSVEENGNLFHTVKTNVSDDSTQKKRTSLLRNIEYEKYTKCWRKIIPWIYDNNIGVLSEVFRNIPTTQLQPLIDSLNTCATEELFEGDAMKILGTLNLMIRERNTAFSINFHPKWVDIMLSEKGLRSESLKFAAKLIEMNRDFKEIKEFISVCIAFCRPVAKEESIPLETVHQFVIAELTFLYSSLNHASNVITCQFPIITELIADFFTKLSNYKREKLAMQTEQLEHSLSKFCSAILRRRNCFHKLVPFVIAGCLIGGHELNYPLYLLFSACDNNDLAFLATNLPPYAQRKFSLLRSQFYERNKIVG